MSGDVSFVSRPWGQMAYSRMGSGQPLVLLHSLALSRCMWDLVSADLSVNREVVAIDFRGHGCSGWDRRPFSVEDLAEDVVALLDSLNLRRADVLGMSMGGTVAVALASSRPERVEHLVLCDTTSWYGPQAPVAWEQRAVAAETTPREFQIPFQTDRWFGERFRRQNPESVSALVGIFLQTPPAVHAQACRALGAYDGRKALGEITAATLVITGGEDYATPPEMGEVLATGIPGATQQVWPGLRHFAIIESLKVRCTVAAHLAGEAIPPPTNDIDFCTSALNMETVQP